MMKKLLVSLICGGLLTSSVASAIMNPQRFAQCIWDPVKYNCTDDEQKETKKWIATASIGAIIAVLAFIGVKVGPALAKKIRAQNKQNVVAPRTQNDLNKKLFDAISNSNINEVASLINEGADINAKDEYNLTPLYKAIQKPDINLDIITLLLEKGALIGQELGRAIYDGNLKKVNILIPHANVNIQDTRGNSLLHIAVAANPPNVVDIAQILITNKADVNIRNKNGETPLMTATLLDRPALVQLFLKNNANKTIKNRDGNTALDLARTFNKDKIIPLLE